VFEFYVTSKFVICADNLLLIPWRNKDSGRGVDIECEIKTFIIVFVGRPFGEQHDNIKIILGKYIKKMESRLNYFCIMSIGGY
jgi:hypothetical protein